MATENSRPRAAAVVLRKGGAEVLMVQHSRRDGSTYWQLPGGGLHSDESAEAGALRELFEETGLQGRVTCWLYSIPYKHGSSSTFLVEVEEGAIARLGYDPEEAERGYRKLLDVAWWSLQERQESPEVRALEIVLSYLDKL